MFNDNRADTAQIQKDFIREAVRSDIHKGGLRSDAVHTRFPPEPNGYLHIGHAKAASISFEIAREFGGLCNLRFDDTNPSKESSEYVTAIQADLRWLGFDWGDKPSFASDYFDTLYKWAVELIRRGNAYVCDLSEEEIRRYRGTEVFDSKGRHVTPPGRDSPYRNRSIPENMELFKRMRDGEFPDGSRTLRARIDMSHPNLNMRDPVMYRIMHASHQRTGNRWPIYPMYDWAHGQCDSAEGISHSLCDTGFENHRPLYDWFLDQLHIHHPRQIEFGRLNLTRTVTSKRRLRKLIENGYAAGWDDPRLPTLRGLRRRGYTPDAIRDFCRRTGVGKGDGAVEIELLEHCLRQHLNSISPRRMAILRPLKIIITNYPRDKEEMMEALNNPADRDAGTRNIPFAREIWIEETDFMESAPRKFFRLSPGREVRLRYAYIIRCEKAVRDDTGKIIEVYCRYDPATSGGNTPDGRKIKGTIHWVSVKHAAKAEIRLYHHLFSEEHPSRLAEDWLKATNPHSLEILSDCPIEPSLLKNKPGYICQFERTGYFCMDPDSRTGYPVFNRSVPLRDSWKKR